MRAPQRRDGGDDTRGHDAAADGRAAPAPRRVVHTIWGKRRRTGRRTVAARGGAACGLLGPQREAHGEEPAPEEPAGEEGRGDQHTAGRRGRPTRAGATTAAAADGL